MLLLKYPYTQTPSKNPLPHLTSSSTHSHNLFTRDDKRKETRKREPLHTSPLVSHEPVGNRLHIRPRRANRIIEIVLVHAAGIVAAEGLVVVVIAGIELLEAVAGLGALGAVADHLEDAAAGVGRVEGDAGVGLHDARVADAVVGGADADVAAGFLHDDAEDDAGVDAGLGRDLLDGGLDEAHFARAVVEGHEGRVCRPQLLEAGPGVRVGEVRGRAAVGDVGAAHARAAVVAAAWGA